MFVYRFGALLAPPSGPEKETAYSSCSFPGNDFSGRQCGLGKLRTTVGKNVNNSSGCGGIGCSPDGRLEKHGESGKFVFNQGDLVVTVQPASMQLAF